ncbi:MAG: transglycosylase domain-containing protein [Candidatus Yanofskybacteria bacterium]|nr:transglycosylase domain-containing protein [Candidatus Yanofskybacteria bacterium]
MKRLKALMSFFGFFLKLIRKIPAFIGWIVLVFFLVSAVVLGSLSHYIYHNRNNLPDIEPFIKFEPPAIGEAYDSRGQVIVGLAKEYRRINRYSDLPPVVVQAVLSAEDKRFFGHHGVDYLALLQAAAYSGLDSAAATGKTWEKGNYTVKLRYSHGGSTLDQQLVKLYFQTGKTDSLWKKLDKIRLAVWLNEEMEKRYGPKAKEEIFARFVSFVYLGNGRYGFDAGAEHFFGKRISDFGPNDVDKAAFLAGLVRHPFPSKNQRMEKYANRRNEVLEQMAENGFVGQNTLKELTKKEVVLAGKTPKTIAPSAVSDMLEELNDVGFTDMQMFEGKVSVHTSIDLKIQEIANRALEGGLKTYEERHPEAKDKIQGAVIVLRNSDAGILAEVGGRPVYNSRNLAYTDFNRAKHARRQPGSAFKPVVYLSAFRNGFTLQDTVMDILIYVAMGGKRPPHKIGNYDEKYKGAITARQALAESRNAAAIWLTYRNGGVKEVMETARLLGINSTLEPYITTSIGASIMSLVELANAFRAIASGLYGQPYLIERVEDRNGEILFYRKHEPVSLQISENALMEIREGLRSNVRLPNGTAHALAASDFPIPVGGKTGTTNDFRDALFVGFTYDVDGITIAVWIGFDDYSQLASRETGARAALPVFKEIMLGVYGQNLIGPAPEFPDNIEKSIDDYLNQDIIKISNPQ